MKSLQVASVLALVVAASLPPSFVAQEIPFLEGDPSFLYLGNSYTSFNNLGNMVGSIIEDRVPEWTDALRVETYTPGGTSLGRHVTDIETGASPAQEYLVTDPPDWKWVVLQDQSQIPGFYIWDQEGGDYYSSLQGAIELNEMITASGGETMFFMTWGRRDGDSRNSGHYPDFLTMQGHLTEGYLRYVNATSTPDRPTFVAPVGLVFETIYTDLLDEGITPEESGTLFHSLYSGDASHPTQLGSYVAAVTIFTSMTGLDPKLINYFPVEETQARLVQDAVSRTILLTFETGFITYPWTTAWTTDSSITTSQPTSQPTQQITTAPTFSPALAPTASPTFSPTFVPTQSPTLEPTSPPTTNSPTATPTQASPDGVTPSPSLSVTDPPTPGPTLSEPSLPSTDLKGSLTVTIIYDEYPQNIAWTLIPDRGGGEALFFQPYDTIFEPHSNQTITFDNLDQNQTYAFRLSDKMGDGICCAHGKGSIKIVDNNSFGRSSVVLLTGGETDKIGAYYEFRFNIGSYGKAIFAAVSYDYKPTTWPDLENLLLAPQNETGWPGVFPNRSRFSLVVNVDLDDNPHEVAWELQHKSNVVYAWNGSTAEAGTLNSTEFIDLKLGWYRFVVYDTAGDGLWSGADSNRSGFVSLTGPLELTEQMGLIWGNNGQFDEMDEVKFRYDTNGYIEYVRFVKDKEARTLAPSDAPSSAPSMSLAPTNDSVESERAKATAPPAAAAGSSGSNTTVGSLQTADANGSDNTNASGSAGPLQSAEYVPSATVMPSTTSDADPAIAGLSSAPRNRSLTDFIVQAVCLSVAVMATIFYS